MKKLLALTLVLMLSLTLFAACGEDDKLVCGVTIFENNNLKRVALHKTVCYNYLYKRVGNASSRCCT